MADTQFDICNRALARVGGARITSFDDGSTEAQVCADEYEGLARQVIASHRWRFAADQRELQLLVDEPAGRWGYAWQLPADCLHLHALTRTDALVQFDRFGDKVFTDVGEGIVADFTFRAPEAMWPGNFVGAFVTDLAAKLALGLARDRSLAADLAAEAGRLWARARNADSQQQTARRIPTGRLIGVRHGGSGWYSRFGWGR